MGLIYLDSCLVIYAVENDPVFGQPVRELLKRFGQHQFAISPLVKLECLVKPIKSGDVVSQRYFEAALSRLKLLEMSDSVFLLAAQLRARFGLKTPDALHLACAQHHECLALWTNDDRLAKSAHGLAKNFVSL
jgi:uncharacterized protein